MGGELVNLSMMTSAGVASATFSTSSHLWLLLTLALPAVGALTLLATPARWWPGLRARQFAVAVAALTVPFSVAAAATGGSFSVPWVPGLGVRFGLRADGLSGPLVVLTTVIVVLCLVHLLRVVPVAGRERSLAGLILLVELGLLGTFLATDLLQFFMFFEVALLPLWFIVAVWGSDVEETLPDGQQVVTTAGQAATQFVCYTVVGSTLMLVGLLLIGAKAGTFDMATLAGGAGLSTGTQLAALALVGTGLAVKVPVWPLHAWLPAAHTAAPTVGSVLLAAVMLKTGTYGLLRIAVPILPAAMHRVAPYAAVFAVIGIVVAALACLRQTDLKRLIAYGSVGHMGFVVLGIATLTPVGLTGAMVANLAHGLITGLLFFLVGALKDRYHTSALADLPRGLYGRLPRLAVLLGFAAIASLGLPGLVGFWGELFALIGAYTPAAGQPVAVFRACMVVALIGMVLTAAYVLRVMRQVLQGPPGRRGWAPSGVVVVANGCAMSSSSAWDSAHPQRPGSEGEEGAPSGVVVVAQSSHPQRPGMGPERLDPPEVAGWVGDAGRHELLVFTPLAVAVAMFGLMPQLLTWLLSPMAEQLLGGGR